MEKLLQWISIPNAEAEFKRPETKKEILDAWKSLYAVDDLQRITILFAQKFGYETIGILLDAAHIDQVIVWISLLRVYVFKRRDLAKLFERLPNKEHLMTSVAGEISTLPVSFHENSALRNLLRIFQHLLVWNPQRFPHPNFYHLHKGDAFSSVMIHVAYVVAQTSINGLLTPPVPSWYNEIEGPILPWPTNSNSWQEFYRRLFIGMHKGEEGRNDRLHRYIEAAILKEFNDRNTKKVDLRVYVALINAGYVQDMTPWVMGFSSQSSLGKIAFARSAMSLKEKIHNFYSAPMLVEGCLSTGSIQLIEDLLNMPGWSQEDGLATAKLVVASGRWQYVPLFDDRVDWLDPIFRNAWRQANLNYCDFDSITTARLLESKIPMGAIARFDAAKLSGSEKRSFSEEYESPVRRNVSPTVIDQFTEKIADGDLDSAKYMGPDLVQIITENSSKLDHIMSLAGYNISSQMKQNALVVELAKWLDSILPSRFHSKLEDFIERNDF